MTNIRDYYQPPSINSNDDMYLPRTNNDNRKKNSFYNRFKTKLIFALLFYITFFKLSIKYSYCDSDDNCTENSGNLVNLIKNSLHRKPDDINFGLFPSISKSFDILKPETQSNKYDEHIFTHKLLVNQEFGHTWGKLVTKTFNPKEIPADYDFIEMTLDVSINGTQYDRLINIYLNDIIIWRSSTIEPLNRQKTKSQVTKDISKYITLFKNEEEIELKFQLDNIIAGDLDGIFVVDLKVDYYLKNQDQFKDKIPKLNCLEKALLNSLNPYAAPDKISSLFSVNKPNKSPMLHFPTTSKKTKPYKLDSLDIDEKTQKLAIELFISGNAGEEFWYSNVLDAFDGKFDDYGYSTLGHGPVRYLNVYLSNELDTVKIFNSIPIPVVFTGGFAPSLWKPVVSLGCFDLKGIYIDLTPYLHFLVSNDHFLEFEIVSSNTDEFDSSIGDNWLISGNLMEWENHDLVFKNTIRESPLVDEYNVTAEETDSLLKQNVTSVSILSKEFGFEFEDKDYILQVTYKNVLKSHIQLKDYGSDETSVLSIYGLKEYTVINDFTKEVVITGEDITQYAFVEGLKIKEEAASKESRYDTNAETSYTRRVSLKNASEIEDIRILTVSASQVGDAIYNISPKNGNSGSGSSVHSVKINRYWPISHNYNRDVVVTKNKVIIDVHKEE